LVTVTDAERETHILDAYAVDGDATIITLVLRVFKNGHGGNKNSHCCIGQQWEG